MTTPDRSCRFDACQNDSVRIEFETESETHQRFAHIWGLDGAVFGKSALIKTAIPANTWLTVPPEYQPAITWYLTRHCDFLQVARIEIDDEWNDVLIKNS